MNDTGYKDPSIERPYQRILLRFNALDVTRTSARRATSSATNTGVSAHPNRARSHKVRRHQQAVVYPHVIWLAGNSLAMPCLLTLDVVVRYKWNGPQCRWEDNAL